MKKPRLVYSVRRARINLTRAVRCEVWSAVKPYSRGFPLPHSTYIARREQAVRDLIASVKQECAR